MHDAVTKVPALAVQPTDGPKLKGKGHGDSQQATLSPAMVRKSCGKCTDSIGQQLYELNQKWFELFNTALMMI